MSTVLPRPVEKELRDDEADRGRDLEAHPRESAHDVQAARARRLADQRPEVRTHVVHPGHAAPDLRVRERRHAAHHPLDEPRQRVGRRRLRERVRVRLRAALAPEVTDERQSADLGAEVRRRDAVDAGRPRAAEPGRVLQDRDLVVLALDRQVEADAGKQRRGSTGRSAAITTGAATSPRSVETPVTRPPAVRNRVARVCDRYDNAHLARPLQEVVRDARAVAVARARLPRRQRHVVHVPVGHDLLELLRA